MEIEEEGCLPFLDVKVLRSDNKLSFSIIISQTHSYWPISSWHLWSPHVSQKQYSEQLSSQSSHSMRSRISEWWTQTHWKSVEKEWLSLLSCTQTFKKQTGKQSENQEVEDQHKGVTFMPYVEGVSDKVCRFLNHAGVKTFYSRSAKLRVILSHPKDPQPKDHAPCVYCINCSCGDQYIGQIKRPLKLEYPNTEE